MPHNDGQWVRLCLQLLFCHMGGDDHHGNGGDGGHNGGGSDVDKLYDDYGELLMVFVIYCCW